MFIIAEIGTAHNGSLEKAKKLIDEAVRAGADGVKFQWVYADEILHENAGIVPLPCGTVQLYDRFRSLEQSSEFYAELRNYAKQKHTAFVCSPFGIRSLRELWELHPEAIKIASPELNHIPLLHALAALEAKSEKKTPVILSSGVSCLKDIEAALAVLEPQLCTRHAADGVLPMLTLLHCVTAYPAPEEEYNVRLVQTLRAVTGIPTGISDHSLDPILIPALSAACGAAILEKHITLSRSDSGLDDPVALTPEQFSEMTAAVRKTEAELENEKHTPHAYERIIGRLENAYGKEKTAAALGNGIKKLAPAERENYTRTNRSVHFVRNMRAGEYIAEKDIAVLRTEKVLTPGIPPEFAATAIGAKLSRSVSAGSGVQWQDIIFHKQ
ncbi:MAG: N-acetylneuraminate synthase family protein [Bacteroides sp.]|nr:N-acetylneuraminate synthase family protein [Prevotella sp.]MCM1407938.1 N-acetylneuraminate synthase family protein [Treponema brennaborense]MCM1469680.1 N-acetylneuraminate synthase family protein [Bacteroides sp.]